MSGPVPVAVPVAVATGRDRVEAVVAARRVCVWVSCDYGCAWVWVRGAAIPCGESDEGGAQAWMSLRRRTGGGSPEAGPDGSRRARLGRAGWLGWKGLGRPGFG